MSTNTGKRWHGNFNYVKMFTESDIQWYIGCSGFYYKEWREFFYPKGLAQKKWFEYYCQHFDTIELNNTFYRFPRLAFLQNWYQKSPPGFTFSVKAPKAITHFKKFIDTETMLSDFYGTIREGLQDKSGPVLFQFFSNVQYSESLLSRIIGQLDPSFTNVLEFRHSSWWNPLVYERLAQHKIVFCGHSHPQLPDSVVVNSEVVYYRFHGVPQLYLSLYPDEFLQSVSNTIKSNAAVRRAYLYFNNTMRDAAIINARCLLQQFAI